MKHLYDTIPEIDKADISTDFHLSTEVITDEPGFDSLETEWGRLVDEAIDVHFVQTFEWQRTWWSHFGKRGQLQILIFRDGEQLVGILPMFLDHFKLLGVSVYRCLRLLGGRVMQPDGGPLPVEMPFGDYLTVIAHPRYMNSVMESSIRWLINHQHEFDSIWLEEVPEESPLFNRLVPRFKNHGWDLAIREASRCPIASLPETWDDLLKRLSSNARYQVRRFVRQATDKNLFEHQRAETKEAVNHAFHKLVEFHQNRWQNLGLPGIFADERVYDFFNDLTLRFFDKGWLRFDILTSKDNFEAVDLSFRFRDSLYMIQRGFDDASPNKKAGPGNVLLYLVIKDAIEHDFKAYDFLRGEARYKYRTATHTNRNREVVIRNKEKGNHFRFGLYNIIHRYAQLSRKLHNEKETLRVYVNRSSPVSGLRAYAEKFYRRMKNKAESSTS